MKKQFFCQMVDCAQNILRNLASLHKRWLTFWHFGSFEIFHLWFSRFWFWISHLKTFNFFAKIKPQQNVINILRTTKSHLGMIFYLCGRNASLCRGVLIFFAAFSFEHVIDVGSSFIKRFRFKQKWIVVESTSGALTFIFTRHFLQSSAFSAVLCVLMHLSQCS